MSIDLVLGVIQAADSSKSQNMRQKLASKSAGEGGLFEKLLSAAKPREKIAPKLTGELDILAGVMTAANPEKRTLAFNRLNAMQVAPTPENAVAEKAMKQLEKSMLTTLVNEMVPDGNDHSLYGDDPAGDFVRDLQVEQISDAVASTEPLSLARKLYGSGGANDLIKSAQWPYFARQKITPYAV